MIHPYEWDEYRILLTVRNRNGTYSFLLNQVSQDEFFGHWMSMWESDRDRKVQEIMMVTLTQASFEMMEPLYTGQYLLE